MGEALGIEIEHHWAVLQSIGEVEIERPAGESALSGEIGRPISRGQFSAQRRPSGEYERRKRGESKGVAGFHEREDARLGGGCPAGAPRQ